MTSSAPTIEAAAHDLGDLLIRDVLCGPCQDVARRTRPALDELLADWLRKKAPSEPDPFEKLTEAVGFYPGGNTYRPKELTDTLLEELRTHAGLRADRAGDERKVSTLMTAVLLVVGFTLGLATAAVTVGLK